MTTESWSASGSHSQWQAAAGAAVLDCLPCQPGPVGRFQVASLARVAVRFRAYSSWHWLLTRSSAGRAYRDRDGGGGGAGGVYAGAGDSHGVQVTQAD
jgi:hypothetical protein